MKVIRCLFCSNSTTIQRISVKKKINDKTITLTNAPVFYCSNCKETFISKEAQDILIEIREKRLDQKKMLFNFDEMVK